MLKNSLRHAQTRTVSCLLLFLLISSGDGGTDLAAEFQQNLVRWRIPSNRPHPRLLIRQTSKPDPQSRLGQVQEEYLASSQQLLSQRVPDFSEFKPSRNPARNLAERFAFSFQLTGDERYADSTKVVLRYMLNWQDWVVPEHKPLTVDLGVAGVACSMAMCYDWIYPTLTESERSEIENALRTRALEPFHRIYAAKSESWTQVHHNWRSVICGEMGITAMAINDKIFNTKEILQQAADGVMDVLNHGGQEGDWDEGIHYWGFGIGQAVLFIQALYHFSDGLLDLYRIPFLQHTGDFGLYMRTPEGDCFGYSDHENGPPRPWLMAALAARFKNPYWQWQALLDAQPNLENLVFLDESVKARPPATLAAGKHFRDTEVATLRSSWEQDAVFLGIKSGRTDINHSHLDLNSFVVHAWGKPLLVDIDTWPYAHRSGFFDRSDRRWNFECNATSGHNTLLVDGQGQACSAESQGHFMRFQSAAGFSYAVAEADKAYPSLLHRFHRFFVLHRGVVLLLDDVEADRPRQLEWLYHYETNIAEQQDGTYVIANGDARAQLLCLRPAANEDRIAKLVDSQSRYTASDGPCVRSNRYLSVRPLHRQQGYRALTVIIPFRENRPPDYAFNILKETDAEVLLQMQDQRRRDIIRFDLKNCRVELQKK